jgi:hypothetical protein
VREESEDGGGDDGDADVGEEMVHAGGLLDRANGRGVGTVPWVVEFMDSAGRGKGYSRGAGILVSGGR